jgi:hypothetical protein
VTCDQCGAVVAVGDYPFCRGNPARHGRGTVVTVGDDIPGGEQIQHCPGLHGRWVYSKSERARLAAEAGYENRVYWTGEHEQHVARMVAVDLTDYDDPAVAQARQTEMAAHCGLTLEAYRALLAAPVERFTGGGDALDAIIAEALP